MQLQALLLRDEEEERIKEGGGRGKKKLMKQASGIIDCKAKCLACEWAIDA
jgi:hypothetical protein